MSHASIPQIYWDEIFSSTVYLINRLPSHTTIPYTSLFNKAPNYSFLRVLGCLCFPYTRDYNSHKLQLRALPCIFLGYALAQKGYRCLHLATNKVFVSINVKFDEATFPFRINSASPSSQPSLTDCTFSPPTYLAQPTSLNSPSQPNSICSLPQPISNLPSQPITSPINSQAPQPTTQPNPAELPSPAHCANHSPCTPPVHGADPIPPATSTSKHPATSQSVHPMTTRTRDNTRKPRTFPNHVAYSTSLETEPTTFAQANTHPEWRHAMAQEIDALAHNQTWTLVPLSPNQNVIGCKWVYKIKRRADGSIEHYKARLVAKGT